MFETVFTPTHPDPFDALLDEPVTGTFQGSLLGDRAALGTTANPTTPVRPTQARALTPGKALAAQGYPPGGA